MYISHANLGKVYNYKIAIYYVFNFEIAAYKT